LFNLYDENIRIEIILAYESLFISIYEAEKILALENTNYLSDFYSILNNNNFNFPSVYSKYWEKDFIPKFEKILEESDSKNEIVNLLDTIYGIIEHFGHDLFIKENSILLKLLNNQNTAKTNNYTLERIMKILRILLNNEANCQMENESDNDDPDEIDHEEEILSNVSNIIIICSEKLGNDFSLNFDNLYFENLKKYLTNKNSVDNISIVLECIADSIVNCKNSIKNLYQDLFNLINDNINKKNNKKYKDENILRNISYLYGTLFVSDPNTVQPYLEVTLNNLIGFVQFTSDNGKDNTISGIAKVVNSQIFEKFEFDYFCKNIIDVIFNNIPLKHDPRQNIAIFNFLEVLINDNHKYYETIVKYSDRVFSFVKFITLNEFSCGIDKEKIKRMKVCLEKLGATNELFKDSFSKFFEKGYANEEEKTKFISIFQNL